MVGEGIGLLVVAPLEMARIDRIKEEIGWLKLVFGVLVAIDASLMGWLAQSYSNASRPVFLAATGATVAVNVAIARVNRLAYRRFEQLEDL